MIKITIEQEGKDPVVLEGTCFIAQACTWKPEHDVLVAHPAFFGTHEELARMMLGLGRNIHSSIFPCKPEEPVKKTRKKTIKKE